jgi:hypothetical protein
MLLFRETLGDRIAADPSVRRMAEILDELNGSNGEQGYVLVAGQPPIHPKIVAGAVLYGWTHGIRSSRRLERACGPAWGVPLITSTIPVRNKTACMPETPSVAPPPSLGIAAQSRSAPHFQSS